MYKLRYYQSEAIDSVFNYFIEGNTGNPVIAAPTGTGKSLIIAGLVQRIYTSYPDQRVMMLTHVKELIEQNFEKLIKLWPTAPAGIYSAGVGRKDTGAKITFAGIQSVAKKPALFGKVDLILIDECHLVSPKQGTAYRDFIMKLLVVNPHLKVIGLTATPYRLGMGSILEDEGLFTDICYDITKLEQFNRLLDEGFLSPLRPKRTDQYLDVDGVKLTGGEFNNKELQLAVDKDEITWKAMQETVANGVDRKSWLLFASGIEHAENMADALAALNISVSVVHGNLSNAENEQRINDFKNGKYQALVNCNKLTTGFDHPGIDLIAVLRPSNSPGLWVQMLGRGTRPVYADGFDLSTREGRHEAMLNGPKQDCLVLDFAGNTKRLGPINDPVIPRKKGKGGGDAPVRICEHCGTYNHASVRFCSHCNAEFLFEVKYKGQASTDELISTEEVVVESFNVDKVTYAPHHKIGRPDAVKVTYFCGLRRFTSYVCIEHTGFASKKARDWWQNHKHPDDPNPVPTTTAEALSRINQMREPAFLKVWLKKPYNEILSYHFNEAV